MTRDEFEAVRAEINRLTAALEDANRRTLEAAAEIERLKAQNDTIFTDAAALTQVVDAMVRANKELRGEVERLKADANKPWLGLATTRELLDELRARIEMHALGGLDYRTVDGEEIAEKAQEPKP